MQIYSRKNNPLYIKVFLIITQAVLLLNPNRIISKNINKPLLNNDVQMPETICETLDEKVASDLIAQFNKIIAGVTEVFN